jgi:hypothetical protein
VRPRGTGTRAARVVALALGAAAVVTVSACGPNHQTGDGPMAADTVRGIVEVAGAEPLTRVVLRTPDGDLPLTGEPSDALRRASGVEVWVAGRRAEDGSLAVEAYRIRAVDGVAATDGVLELDGDAAVLVTHDGERVRYAPAPPALRALVGQRVWIAGRAGGEPQAWGTLDPAR